MVTAVLHYPHGDLDDEEATDCCIDAQGPFLVWRSLTAADAQADARQV